MQERHLLPFATDQLTPDERQALRGLQAQRRWRVIASIGAAALALAVAGCPEPADLQNANMYPSPNPTTSAGTGTGGGSTGGSGNTAGTGGGSTGVECEVACMDTLISTSCQVCHGKATKLSGTLDFETKPYTPRLKDQPAPHVGASTGCQTTDVYIDSKTPANSWLLKKVLKQQGTCGTEMPAGGATDAEMKCVQDYVNCVAGVK